LPVVSEFSGIVIRMYYQDHEPLHFHAEHDGEHGTFDGGGHLLAGRIGSRTARELIREWALARTSPLRENWKRARLGQPLMKIDPLE